ncbi:carbon-nitrogen hydrolase family protein [Aliiglaciecola sp. LCG003]|uniref:carbon-nitrogen hydrolase family protein n=1 Tax=Aliiglaciecola sp. LCG003 TaxID=3053655 RepID=UPI0025730745|nr:carbon-nitrogen hydrolase family protein [Aliiglaciecola sp. LCG003]WJG09722.1 carbon-nitrogen hydrolase family protein [Aliiglaciecola sp. LCG003]
MAKLVACQMVSEVDPDKNLAIAEQLIAQQARGSLVVLPECFASFGAGDAALLAMSEVKGRGKIQDKLSQLAKEYGVWLVAGTVPIKAKDANKYTASSLVFDDTGKCIAEYQKIHLFDVQIEDSTRHYQESKFTEAGDQIVVLDTPFGKLGIAVCYDVRFAGMFQAMGQLDVLALPSAFTRVTGAAHWHSLISARAIENQCYLVAANQGGLHANGRETYGHSLVASPWGQTLAEIESGEGAVSAVLDLEELKKIRNSMPVHEHNQFRSYLVKSGRE